MYIESVKCSWAKIERPLVLTSKIWFILSAIPASLSFSSPSSASSFAAEYDLTITSRDSSLPAALASPSPSLMSDNQFFIAASKNHRSSAVPPTSPNIDGDHLSPVETIMAR